VQRYKVLLMKHHRKICVITGSRAEYGLLYPLIKKIDSDSDLTLQLIVTGMHFSKEFGFTYKHIKDDGFLIENKLDMLLSSDSAVGIAKSMGVGLIGIADLYEKLAPDLILVLGDRFEIFSAVSAALMFKIPVAHIHGGEVTLGAIDDSMRHCISKMSHLHFSSNELYRKRLIQLGENPNTVFNVGALGVENISKVKLLEKRAIESLINFNFSERNLLISFHPATLEEMPVEQQFNNILLALDKLEKTHLIFTKSNADAGGKKINSMIDEYVANNPSKAIAYTSLGREKFYSVLNHMDGIVGNSSSGIIEAPSLQIGTINIGERQAGRILSSSVINSGSDQLDIENALDILYSVDFRNTVNNATNPYYGENTSDKIFNLLKYFSLKNITKKTFFDINVSE
jgi:GDP/UDP-N,N'-diacetylbacillosamine 2-epimerase (hydrolysing)